MRQLIEITPARVANRSMPHAKTLFGPYWRDLYRFLAIKYRINDDSMRAILTDAFRYIDSEVMVHGEYFAVPGFGRFERVTQPSGSSRDGSDAEGLKVRRAFRKYQGTLFTQHEDPEDAGPS